MVNHYLTPRFILHKFAAGEESGRFEAAALFVDVSGFTAATEVLMQHGQHGAEIMAQVMRTLFAPLVEFVYAYNGFVTGFAGDAFTAVFPINEADPLSAAVRALAAGARVQQHMTSHSDHETPYGKFSFGIKVGIAQGETKWGILAGEIHQQHTYYFSGHAIDECAHAEHFAERGDLIISQAILAETKSFVTAAPLVETHEFVRVTSVKTLPTAQTKPFDDVHLKQANRFMSEDLLTQTLTGEFRQIISMFISMDGVESHGQLAKFMKVVFDLQTSYGGFFNRIDFGDKGCNLLLFWGAPIAHENDVSRALNFVLDLQQATTLPMRVGITYYIAHAGYVGAPIREEYTCLSRGVNLSARHMMAADWGDIWLDERLADRAEDMFDIDFVEYLPFKGFADPQPVYRLNGREMRASRNTFEGRMVGRDEELSQLANALHPLQNGRFAGVLSIFGEAGMGKSRLVYELGRRVQSFPNPPQWFFCPADEIFKQSLNPFRYWLRRYFNLGNEQSDSVKKERFTEKLDQLIEQTSDEELRHTLDRTRSLLGALVDLYWPDSLYEQLEPQLRFENSLEALKALIKAESLQQPVVIELDDMHWADEDTVQFARQLTHNVDEFPIAIITASREALPPEMFDAASVKLSISLNTLSINGIRQFMRMMMRQRPSDALVKFLAERTDGNPFYLEQVMLYLTEQGNLSPTAGEETIGLNFSIPTDVQAVLVARLDRLTQEVRNIVQTASVLGREFETRLLSEMLRNDSQIEKKVHEAEHAAVWVALNEIRYIFKHGMMREAAYDMQLRSRLQDLHHLAATALESVYQEDASAHYAEIAYHYDRSDNSRLAVDYYAKAGQQATKDYHNKEALSYLNRALILLNKWTDPEEVRRMRYTLLMNREAIYDWQGKRQEQAADLETLSQLASQLGFASQAAVALRQANYALVTNEYAAAEQAAQQAMQFGRIAQDKQLEGAGYLLWGKAAMRLASYKEARTYLKNALHLLKESNSSAEEADALMSLGHVLWNQGQLEEAKNNLQEALTIQRNSGNRRGEAGCLNALGAIHSETGDYVTASRFSENVLEICRDIGYRQGETIILRNLGADYHDLGDYEAAQTYLLQARDNCQEINDQWGVAISLDTLGLVENGLGHLELAKDYHQQAIALQKQIGDQDGLGYTYTHLGHTLSALGQWSEAAAAYQQGINIRQTLKQEALNVDNQAGLARVRAEQGQTAEAQEAIGLALNHLYEFGSDGVEYPVLAYWHCYVALQKMATNGVILPTSGREVLQSAHDLLRQRAENIKSDVVRKKFLENVPSHRAVTAALQSTV